MPVWIIGSKMWLRAMNCAAGSVTIRLSGRSFDGAILANWKGKRKALRESRKLLNKAESPCSMGRAIRTTTTLLFCSNTSSEKKHLAPQRGQKNLFQSDARVEAKSPHFSLPNALRIHRDCGWIAIENSRELCRFEAA